MKCPRFFSSYNSAPSGWNYIMGNFAQMTLPLTDSVKLTVQRLNSSATDTFTVGLSLLIRHSSINSLVSSFRTVRVLEPQESTSQIPHHSARTIASRLRAQTESMLTRVLQSPCTEPLGVASRRGQLRPLKTLGDTRSR